MTDLDLDAIEARRQVACLPYTTEATISAVLTITRIDVPALVALVRAKESWIDGAKVDMAALEEAAAKATTWHMEALDDLAACVAERDDLRRRYEALRDGVLAWAEKERLNGSWWVDTAISEVIARVEGDES